ncbi:MAG: hypothetical protein LRS46_00555 [Desulfurococcales archaeon]|nr:hypothetical protein [Desulfurococcales archaeon]
MVTAKEAFEARKLAAKYGVPGKVAALYRMAGYIIDVISTDEDAPIHFKASKRRESLAVKVYWRSGRVSPELVEGVAGRAKELNSKPVLVLYGSGPRITQDALNRAKELGVSIRRVRPS